MQIKRFPFFKQLDAMDCGPASLKIIAKYYGRDFSMKFLRDKCNITREGVSLLSISKTAEEIKLRSLALKMKFEDLSNKIPLPCIIHWEYSHFVVVYKITRKKVFISDPQIGLVSYSINDFCYSWKKNEERGYVLVLEPETDFLKQKDVKTQMNLKEYYQYLVPHRRLIIQAFLGTVMSIVLTLVFPMITQSIVDIGIFTRDLDFINVLLIASLVLTLSSILSGYFQSRVMLYVGDRVNMSMVSDFIKKILKLPLVFYERKMVSDILARIGDHSRIQSFIFDSLLGLTVSGLSILAYGIILFYYSLDLLLIFSVGTAIYAIWIFIFLPQRKKLDYKFFDASINNQSEIIQIFDAIQEVKVNNLQQKKRWDWEKSRLDIYNLNIKMLNLNQTQNIGASIIDKLKNIFLTFVGAKAVISGQMSLGMMMSIQYIIGQLNGPVGSLLGLLQSSQNAKISLERVGEVRFEEKEEKSYEGIKMPFPKNEPIILQNVGFKYNGNDAPVLKNVNLEIPNGKITAIVGESGSGKTTLVKILLRFYEPTEGKILIGDTNFDSIELVEWRDKCGAVLQDGKLLAGTILENITLQEEDIDTEKLRYAVKTCNLDKFIESLPLRYYTTIGQGGIGVSGGQEQRFLIARAIYKNPDFIFFDEATNSLDANNEKEISENLIKFTAGKTAIVIAHRLSTIMAAEQIVVMEKGEIVERGTHQELLEKRGKYFDLVKNQMFETQRIS